MASVRHFMVGMAAARVKCASRFGVVLALLCFAPIAKAHGEIPLPVVVAFNLLPCGIGADVGFDDTGTREGRFVVTWASQIPLGMWSPRTPHRLLVEPRLALAGYRARAQADLRFGWRYLVGAQDAGTSGRVLPFFGVGAVTASEDGWLPRAAAEVGVSVRKDFPWWLTLRADVAVLDVAYVRIGMTANLSVF